MHRFCDRCVEDRLAREDEDYGNGCSILADVLFLGFDSPDYPKQWIEDDSGENPRCTAFVEDVGQDMPIRNVDGIKLT